MGYAAAGRGAKGHDRPEISVLLAHSKAALFERLVATDLVKDARLQRELLNYFPSPLRRDYRSAILDHPLRREILAAHLTNLVVNRMGATFCNYLLENSSADAASLVRAFIAARDLLGIEVLDRELDRLVGELPHSLLMELQLRLHGVLHRMVFRLFRKAPGGLGCDALIRRYQAACDCLRDTLPEQLPGSELACLQEDAATLAGAGVPVELADALARLKYQPIALEVEEVRQIVTRPLADCLRQYLAIGAAVELHWIRREIESLPLYDKWYRKAREALHDGLLQSVRQLAVAALSNGPVGNGKPDVAGLAGLLGELRSMDGLNIAMLTTMVGQLSRLASSPETV
ncbi:MAG: NAD-glutamate dehydrogenase [Oceanospirillaceae bacterium]|nr:NAD-glutamate dehydrogenase [Oceanospirillaceae bacterium]